jgi:hypothetical protein
MKCKIGTFREFKEFTLAVVRGERTIDPDEPKVWVEPAPDETAGPDAKAPARGAASRALRDI